MKQYLGVKLIHAKPMTRLEYNSFRGWDVPTDENPDDPGYLVEYQDGGQANTQRKHQCMNEFDVDTQGLCHFVIEGACANFHAQARFGNEQIKP